MELKVNIESKEQVEELIKQLQEYVNKKDILYPEIEEWDDYWTIGSAGNVYIASGKDVGTEFLANIYKTEEVAQKALAFKKSRKIWNFIENWVMHNSTFEPDWNDGEQVKYYIWYDSETSIWDMYYTYTTNVGIVYMSEEECEKLVKILNSSDEYKL